MKTLAKTLLITAFMGSGLAMAAQQQSAGANTSPVSMQGMGGMMGMTQNMTGMTPRMKGTMQAMQTRNTMMGRGGAMMGQGGGMMGQVGGMMGQAGMGHNGMSGGHMANGRRPSSKAPMAKSNCNRHAHRHMDRQNMTDGQQASTDAAGSNAG